ncbi:hypothetical protein T261_0991 [Streptomyces lydicus]|nr:hypothetical protein T261_0991 [Streptomyces lydicus]
MTAPPVVRPPAVRTPRPVRWAHHPLRAELRGGPARWAALAMSLTLLLPLAAKSAYWQGSWYETQEHLHTAAALLGGPLALAAGCWQGGREQRSRMTELRASAARGPLAQFLMTALPVMLGGLAGYAVIVCGALLASRPYVSAGRPLVGPLAADAVFLAAMTMAGTVAGRLWRWRLAAPTLAVCAYVVLGVPTYQSGAVRFLSPATFQSGAALPVWWQPLAMAAWTGGLASAAVVAHTVRRHRYTAVLPLALAVAAAVPVVRTGEDMWHRDPLGERQVCDDSTPRVCVNTLDGGLLPQVSRALSGVTRRLHGWQTSPSASRTCTAIRTATRHSCPSSFSARASYAANWPIPSGSHGRPWPGWCRATAATPPPVSAVPTTPFRTG